MKFFKKVLFSALLLGTLSAAAFAADAEIPDEHLKDIKDSDAQSISILCVGNSILAHGPSESIGWSGSWGMAASAQEKDYFHLLQQKVADAGYSNVVWSSVGVASLERAIDKRMDYDYASEINSMLAPSVTKALPDVVIFQIGENVNQDPTRASYELALTKFAEYCMSVNPDVQIIFCKPFWDGKALCMGAQNAAINLGFTYADLAQFNTNDNKAIGLFEHVGVANHPGDKGMANIADEIFKQLDIILYKKCKDPAQVEVKLDGKYITFDVLPRLVNDRTMIPVRAVAEAFGADVDWDEETETVIIENGSVKILMKLGENFFTKNGEKIELDAPAFETDGRTLVPARAIAESLDCKVDWDDKTQTALVFSPVEETAKLPTAVEADPCENLKKYGFYAGGNSKVSVVDDNDEHGKVYKVEATTAGKSWTYNWVKMDLEPGKTYIVEADLKAADTNGAGETVDKGNIGFCLHFDGKDHGIGMTQVTTDEWTHAAVEYSVPEGFTKNPDNDSFGIFTDPLNNIAGSFYVDNITVKVKE